MTAPVTDHRDIVRYMNRRLAVRRALAYGRPAWCVSLGLLVALLLVGMATLILADWGPERQGVEVIR